MINEFEMFDMGLLHYFFGLKVHHDNYGNTFYKGNTLGIYLVNLKCLTTSL